ncbi:MAG: hypothetical protein WCI53_11865 [Bacteroidota bacterium]|jgi:hypothetical protein
MKINKEWHLAHIIRSNPTLNQRIYLHVEHQKYCNCRPIPEILLVEINNRLNINSLK